MIDAMGAEIRVLHEKEMLRDMRANLSVELGDFIGCPCCNTPMGEPEAGDGMLCPECEYRTASRGSPHDAR